MKIIELKQNRVWRTYIGGKNLDFLAGKDEPSDSHFPEDWIASLTGAVNPGREHLLEEGFSTVMIEGKQILLRQLIEMYPEEMLGKNHYRKYGATTSFLLKFLDSAIRLHIQCHPTISFAKKFLNIPHGKTEGYYILATRDEVKIPYIYLGFQNPPPKEKLKEAIEHQDIEFLESCFEKIPVKKGDAFIVPGGLPHAIGEGIFMIEIMEPTDLAVRIEFEKAGYVLPEKARFMNRGIDFAISMFNFSSIPIGTIRTKYFISGKLVGNYGTAKEFVLFDSAVTSCFKMNKLIIKGEFSLKKDGFYIAIVTGGTGTMQSEEETFNIKFGDKFFIPALTDVVHLKTTSFLELVLALPPE